MTEEEFQDYVHESVHASIDFKDALLNQFGIGRFKRWSYDLEQGTLVFSNDDDLGVVATIQAAGSISTISNTWLWGWANASLPETVTSALQAVRDFGEEQGIQKLTNENWSASEADGWEMSAVTNRIIGGKGIYRCPDEKGCFFLILMDIKRLQ